MKPGELNDNLLQEEGKDINNSNVVARRPPLVHDTCWRRVKGWFNMNTWFYVSTMSG